MSGSQFRGKFVEDARIAAEILAWKTNRSIYPGWIILPHNNRRRLWEKTRIWSSLIQARCQEQGAIVALSWLAELVWRTSRSLMPVTKELADLLEWCIKSVVPVSSLIEGADTIHPSAPATVEVNWSDVTAQWNEVTSSLMRFKREQRDKRGFDSLREKAEFVGGLTDFAAYESCLMGLETPDLRAVRKQVHEWSPSELVWSLRRTGVLIELGEGREARRLALDIVEAARRHSGHDSGRFEAISIEGWALQLIWATEATAATDLHRRETPAQRWHELARYKCDPFEELNPIRDALGTIRDRLTRRIRNSGSYAMHDDEAVGIVAARLCEEAAQPTWYQDEGGFGRHILSGHLFESAAIALGSGQPRRALSLLFRAGDAESVEAVLDTHRVAALDKADAAEFLASVRFVLNGPSPMQVPGIAQPFSAALQIAAHLVCRAPIEDVMALLKCSISLLGNAVIARHRPVWDGSRKLLSESLSVLSPDQKGEVALLVLGLPLVGCDPIPVHARLEDDVAMMLLGNRLGTVQQSGVVVTKLLAGVAEGGLARARALLRLAVMFRAGMLSPEVVQTVAVRVWDNGEAWPEEVFVPDWVIVNLPEPRPGLAETVFRARCVKRAFPSLYTEMKLPDGETRRGLSGINPYNDPLDNVLTVTSRPWNSGINDGYVRVAWAAGEIEEILGNALRWWNGEGKELARTQKPDREMQPNLRLRLLSEFIAYAAVPATSLSPEILQPIVDLLEDAGSKGWPVDAAWPILTRLSHDCERRATRHLRAALSSGSRERSRYAAFASFAWLEAATAGVISKPPQDLIDSLAREIRMRRPELLVAALFFFRRMVQLRRVEAVGGLLDDVAVGLEYLLEDTRYRVPSEADGAVPYAEVPQVKEYAAALAGTLTRMAVLDSDLANRWREIGTADSLTAVKRAYEEALALVA
jgi:hypothetical protein